MHELPKPQSTTQQAKQLFYNLCVAYDFDNETLQKIADMASVHKGIVDTMFVSVAVRRVEAEKVLMAFSEYTGKTWTLSNVRVAIMPTIAELHAEHQFDLARLATSAGVPFATIDMMLSGHAVIRQDAMLVLQMVSLLKGERYTLNTVDVLINEEVQHE